MITYTTDPSGFGRSSYAHMGELNDTVMGQDNKCVFMIFIVTAECWLLLLQTVVKILAKLTTFHYADTFFHRSLKISQAFMPSPFLSGFVGFLQVCRLHNKTNQQQDQSVCFMSCYIISF